MNIITLTLSPAYDRYCRTECLKLEHENLVHETCRTAGGKGINISRALHAAGVPSTAVAVLGEENGAAFAKEVRGQGIDLIPLWQSGRIRENITIAADAGEETRISFPGFAMDQGVLNTVFDTVRERLAAGDVLTLTGRLPQGITAADVMPFLKELKCKGVLLVIDSKSFSYRDLMDLAPWLIKPNQEEIALYYAQPIHTRTKALNAANSLHRQGIANVMISLGSRGAVLVGEQGAFACKPPHLSVCSTVGAGDSSIAGFLTAYYNGCEGAELLRHAVAFGSAACLTDGPLPPDPDTMRRIAEKLTIDS